LYLSFIIYKEHCLKTTIIY